MLVRFDEYISGGYIVTRFADGAQVNGWMRQIGKIDEDLLPNLFLSVGFCESPKAPIFDWAGASAKDYAAFHIPSEHIVALNEWANARFDTEIGYPNIFFDLAVAREYLQRFATSPNDIQLLGIGLHQEQLGKIAELERSYPPTVASNDTQMAGFTDTGFAKALKRAQPVELGDMLGYDVICCTHNIDHSWHCSNLPVDGLQQFGFRPNQFGLIDDKSNADKIAAYASEQDAGGNPIHGEEGVYLPVLVTRYSTQVEE
jgi:hypothetical protein